MTHYEAHCVASMYANEKFTAQVRAMKYVDRSDIEVACKVALAAYDDVLASLEMAIAMGEP